MINCTTDESVLKLVSTFRLACSSERQETVTIIYAKVHAGQLFFLTLYCLMVWKINLKPEAVKPPLPDMLCRKLFTCQKLIHKRALDQINTVCCVLHFNPWCHWKVATTAILDALYFCILHDAEQNLMHHSWRCVKKHQPIDMWGSWSYGLQNVHTFKLILIVGLSDTHLLLSWYRNIK